LPAMINVKEIKRIFDEFREKLRNMEKVVEVSPEYEDNIRKAIQWLKSVQHPDGYWGTKALADTGLSLLALSNLGVRGYEKWEIPSDIGKPYEGGIEKAVMWLKKKCGVYGCESNVWDTSVVLEALTKLGIEDELRNTLAQWLSKYVSENFKSLKLHHIARAIIALYTFNDKESAKKIAERLEERLKSFENLDDAYVCGQIVEALSLLGYDPYDKPLSDIVNFLQNYLEKKSIEGLSEPEFQSVVVAMNGLATSRVLPKDSPIIKRLVGELFRFPERFKPSGSWYEDAKKTAFALTALSKLKKIAKIDVHPSVIYDKLDYYQNKILEIINNANDNIKNMSRELFRASLFLIVGVSSLLILGFIVVTNIIPSQISGYIVDIFLSALGIDSIRRALEVYRKWF